MKNLAIKLLIFASGVCFLYISFKTSINIKSYLCQCDYRPKLALGLTLHYYFWAEVCLLFLYILFSLRKNFLIIYIIVNLAFFILYWPIIYNPYYGLYLLFCILIIHILIYLLIKLLSRPNTD